MLFAFILFCVNQAFSAQDYSGKLLEALAKKQTTFEDILDLLS